MSKNNILRIIFLVLITALALVSVSLYQKNTPPSTSEPSKKAGGSSQTIFQANPPSTSDREIILKEGVKHNISLEDVFYGLGGIGSVDIDKLSSFTINKDKGALPVDRIPAIDNPKFQLASEASKFIDNDDVGIAIDINGTQRFYPFQILVWHEMVNDKIGEQRILVTYCPLCYTAVVYDPLVDGERVEFGTSGLLWNSNLIMYDRKSFSLWSQVLGESVIGEMVGTRLRLLPSDLTKFGDWKRQYPDGEVLSRDTGTVRLYGNDPYGDYYTSPGTFFSYDNENSLLPQKAIVSGIIVNKKAKAYEWDAVKRAGEFEDEVGDKTFVVQWVDDLETVRIFEKQENEALVRVYPLVGFWFSWASVHPDSAVYSDISQ